MKRLFLDLFSMFALAVMLAAWLVSGGAFSADAVAAVAPPEGGEGWLFSLLAGVRTATGTAAFIGIATKLVTGFLRNTAILRRLPVWLSGSEPGVPPTGWRVQVLVFVVALVIVVGRGALVDHSFVLTSYTAWESAAKGLASAILVNEIDANVRGDKATN